MKEDGTMARRPDLDIFCKKHDLNIVYISDIVEYRMMNESLIRVITESTTKFMEQEVRHYDIVDHRENHHIAYTFGKAAKRSVVKFHNVIKDSELLASSTKFNALMHAVKHLKENEGVLIFLEKEENPNIQIREYGIGAQIVKYLGIEEIKLLVATKEKDFVGISGFGLGVVEQSTFE